MFTASQQQALARLALSAQGVTLSIAFVLLGLGSALFARVFWASGLVPRWLAAVGVVASLLLSASAVLGLLWPYFAATWQLTAMMPMGSCEVTLGGWLLFGALISPARDRANSFAKPP